MSKRTSEPSIQDVWAAILAVGDEIMRFVPPGRVEEIAAKWLSGWNPGDLSEHGRVWAVADMLRLSADLSCSSPSASGSTAIDRMAKSRRDGTLAQTAALLALRQARFRILAVESATAPPHKFPDAFVCRDMISRQSLLLVGTGFAPSIVGLKLFGRVVMMAEGLCIIPSTVTPLDDLALQFASRHPASTIPSANAKWADAVYRQVVRHGTLEIPGVNRPAETQSNLFGDAEPAGDDPIHRTVQAWLAIGDHAPDAALLRRTRELAISEHIVIVIGNWATMRQTGDMPTANALERMARVMVETIMRRERIGSGTLTMDLLKQSIEQEIRRGMPRESLPLFTRLRDSLLAAGGMPVRDDLALARLMARIQALRAKTTQQGCTEPEAIAAAEKVAELLDRHGLSLGELEFRAQPCAGIGIDTNRRRFGAIDICVPSIAAFFDCRVWSERAEGAPVRYVFFGLRADVAAAQYLYELVERAFETETKAFRDGDLYANLAGERRRATTSFQTGMANGIMQKLAALRAARDAHCRSLSGRDLVQVKASMVDEEVEKLGLSLTRRAMSAGAKMVLRDAFNAGKAAGERFEYAAAIGTAA
jgi:hypothetical protein